MLVHLSLIFEGKAKSLPSEWSLGIGTTWVSSSLVDLIGSLEHPSLFGHGIITAIKSFIAQAPDSRNAL